MSKRKPTRAAAPLLPGERRPLPPPVDFKGRPPMIVTLGSDLEESRRLAARLQALREAAHGQPA